MDTVQVEYSILDNVSAPLESVTGKMKGANNTINSTTQSVGNLTNAFERVAKRIAEYAIIYKAASEITESYELFNTQELAMTKMAAVYQDNAKYTRENIQGLKDMAAAQEGLTGVHREDIETMEAALLPHHDIKVSYEKIIPTVIDYAKATGETAVMATNQLSKVLGNPLMAMRLLRTAHIDITKAQSKWMENMYNSGHYIEYQTKIIDMLGDRYKGTAAKMLAANPGERIELQFRQAQAAMGEMEKGLLIDFEPAIERFVGDLKDGAHWLGEHKKEIEGVIKIAAFATAGYLAWQLVLKGVAIWTAASNGAMIIQKAVMAALAAEESTLVTLELVYLNLKEALTVAIYGEAESVAALNVAYMGLVGVLGLAVVGMALYASQLGAVDNSTDNTATHLAKIDGKLVDIRSNAVKAADALHGIFVDPKEKAEMEYQHFMGSESNKELGQANKAFKKKYGMSIKEAHEKGIFDAGEYKMGIGANRQFSPGISDENLTKMKNDKAVGDDLKTGVGESTGDLKSPSEKITNINIHIQEWVHSMNFNTANLKENLALIREEVVKTIISAVNDSEVIAPR